MAHIETSFKDFLVGQIWGFPVQMAWATAFAFVAWLILNRHAFGAHVYYVGNNEISARLMGIDVDKVKIITFAMVGLGGAISGVMATLINRTFYATLGEAYLLPVLAMIFVGGNPPKGGVGTIFGVLMGSLVIGIIDSGLIAAGLVGFWTKVFYGLVIVLSIISFRFLR